MYDGKGNRYTYRWGSYGCIIYKNDKYFMEVVTENEAEEMIKDFCNER